MHRGTGVREKMGTGINLGDIIDGGGGGVIREMIFKESYNSVSLLEEYNVLALNNSSVSVSYRGNTVKGSTPDP